ncbi:zinc finger BED domain-containing protein 4-like [Toxorhynchites rutilus septentrionalis]|uniref:zinc finger BED domain-containing protein 4-like n=1 Tax=Toxorhynchites rutilus septentrionalis TaxID=329112 RepID=UPI00247B17DC|nr:zinc finger BED domain-containing protein 4-like [Toxorhynchites rutilus septentrionalis]
MIPLKRVDGASKEQMEPRSEPAAEAVETSGDVQTQPLPSSQDRKSATTSDTSTSGSHFTRFIPQSSMTQFAEIVKPISPHKSRLIDIQLLKMICKEFHPFSIVEDEEFKKFIHLLNPSYTLPSRKTLSTGLMLATYNELVAKVKSEVLEAPAVCITCDGWTSMTNTGFYALTAHFIDKNGTLKSYLLECSEFTPRHTGENIAKWVSDVLPNILNMRQLGCFAHSLSLVVQNAIKNSIQQVVDKCKTIAQFFKKSSHATSKLTEMQEKLGKPTLKLKQDVPTRWNSTFDMLERMMVNKESVISTLALLDPKRCTLDNEDWEIIEPSMDILRTFNEVTVEISAEKSATLSKSAVLARMMIDQTKLKQQSSDSLPPIVKKLVDE